MHSIEASGSARARLIEDAGFEYLPGVREKFDIVIEAAGADAAANLGLRSLKPLGVLMILGARSATIPLLEMIVGNQIVAGSVNAGPEAFHQAGADLAQFPASILERMLDRRAFGDYRRSILEPSPNQPKITHV
ncbi:MAG: hypothetical protein WKF37_18840 [Bryobacteraceae bacterium]